HRHLPLATGLLDREQRILHLLLKGNVTRHDGDRLEVRPRMQQPDDEREAVVGGGVSVNDEAADVGGHSRGSLLSLVLFCACCCVAPYRSACLTEAPRADRSPTPGPTPSAAPAPAARAGCRPQRA